ncbi:MAG: DUF5119 domain-containing protein [Bacteroidales bacterium]
MRRMRIFRVVIICSALFLTLYALTNCCKDCNNETESGIRIDWSQVSSDAPIPNNVKLLFFSQDDEFIKLITSPATLYQGELPQTTRFLLALGNKTSSSEFRNLEDFSESEAWLPALFTINDTTIISESGWIYRGFLKIENPTDVQLREFTVMMEQCNRIIRFILNIKGTGEIVEIVGEITGLSRGVNFATSKNLSQTGVSQLEFMKLGDNFVSEINCFGVSPLNQENKLILIFRFSNGKTRKTIVDVTNQLLKANQNKPIPLQIPISFDFSTQASVDGSIAPWEEGNEIKIVVN